HHHVGEHGEQDQQRPDGGQGHAHRPQPPPAMRPAGPGVMPAVRPGPSSPPTAGSRACTALAISRRMYQVPKPNTMKYTTMKASSEAPTAGASSGEALSAVVSSPCTVNGWRPTSVVIQPAITATKPAGAIASAARCSAGQSYSRPRSRASRLHAPSASIASPSTTITRNDQNTIATGGCS